MNRKQRRTAAKAARISRAPGPQASSVADNVVQKAIQAAQSGALREAEAALDEVLARFPDHIEAIHQKGMILARGERIEEGIALLRRAVAAKPGEALYWNNLAAAQLTAKRPADALPAAHEAVRLDAGYVMALQNLAMAQGDLRLRREQAETLGKLLKLTPRDADSWNQLGLAWIGAGDMAAAESAFREAVAVAPRNPEYLSNFGVALVQRGLAQAALPHLELSLAIDPERFTAALHYGLALSAMGEPAKGLRWLRRATSIKPRSDMAWGALADAASAAGEKAEALDAARRAAGFDPTNAAHAERLSRLQVGQAPPAGQAPVVTLSLPSIEPADLSGGLDQIFIS